MKNPFKQKWFQLTIISIVVFLAIPTVAFGGTFVVSLIQGKTAEEAVQILAEQLDGVLDRLGVIENKQTELEQAVQTSTTEIDNLKDKNAGLEQSVVGLETKNADLQNKVNCQELIKKTPQRGEGRYININIVDYYNFTKSDLENSRKSLEYLPIVKNSPTQENIDKIRSFEIIRDTDTIINDIGRLDGWYQYWTENLSAQIKFDEENLSEAQPLYNNYTAQCGEN